MKLLIFCCILSVCSAFDFDCLKGPDFWCKDFLNAQKCGKITECFMENKIQKKNVISQKPSTSDLNCNLCLEIAEFLNKKLETKQQFVDFINQEVCGNLKGETQNLCKLLVSQYGGFIYDKIKTELNPQTVCKLLRFCDSQSILRRKHYNFPRLNPTDICTKCKEFFQIIQSVFEKITPDELKLFLDNFLCNQLPSEIHSTCKMLIDGYVGQLYELIKTLIDGDRICPLIHLCSAGVPPFLGSWSCDTCVDIVTVLKKDLANVTESNIEDFIKSSLCSKLNFLERPVCNNYVSQLVPTFYNDIHSSATPQQICAKDKLCHSTKPSSIGTPPKIKGIECEACKLAVTQVKKFISDPTKQNFIKDLLKNKVCPIFLSEKTKCQQLVDEYFTIILNFLISELDVDKVCHLMNLCSSNVASIECSVCEAVMNRVIAIAFSNRTEYVVSTFVSNKICPILGSVKDECVTLVNTYLPIVFSIARATLNSKLLCEELKLCTVITSQEIKFAMKNIQNGSVECEICTFIVTEVRSLLTNPTVQNEIQNLIKNYLCKYLPNPQNCVNDVNEYFSLVLNIILQFLNPSLCTELHLCSSPNSFIMMKQPMIIINNSKKRNQRDCQLCSKFYGYLQSITGGKYRSNGVMGLINLCNQIGKRDKPKCIRQFKNFSAIVKSFNKSTSLSQFCKLTDMCSDIDSTPHHRVGESPCTWGPAFWCISQWHASTCGTGAIKHCEMTVWNQMPRRP